MIAYEFVNACQASIDEKHIKTGLERATEKLDDIGDRFVSIECVSSREIQHFNHKLRNKEVPTDIISISSHETKAGKQDIRVGPQGELSFELHQSKPVNPLPAIGQLIICYDVIKENAARTGQPPERELEWVIEHGVYHLMGFHHDSD